jgi:capsular exopolysaccharide synthesis family protein
VGIDQLLAILWRRKAWVVLTFAVTVGAAAALAYNLPKVYTSKTYLLVQPSRPSASDYEATQVSTTLNTTYAELLDTRNVALEVAKELPPDVSRDLTGKVTVEPVTESQLIAIEAEGASPEQAQTIANTYATVFVRLAGRFAGQAVASGRVTQAVPAPLSAQPARPRPKLYIALAAILGAMLAIAVGLLRNRFDQRLDITPDTTELFGLPVIARLPQRSGESLKLLGQGRMQQDSDARALAEGFRLLLANLAFANLGERPRTLAVLSSAASEGKSITALSLGRAAAEVGIPTLLVDADLRRPSLMDKIGDAGADPGAGLSSFLVRSTLSLSEAVVPLGNNLDLTPAGPIPPNPAALLGSKALAEFDRRAQRAYEFVIYDTPPLSIAADASLLATNTEGAILVVDVRNAKRKVVLQAVDQLRRTRCTILGVVLNRVPESQGSSYGYGYYGEAPAEEPEPLAGQRV